MTAVPRPSQQLTTMPSLDLNAFFAEHIPLTRAMQLRLERWDDDGLLLSAPLAPNVNDKGTAFAGSLSSIITLSGWALTTLILHEAGETAAQVAVGRAELDYRRPVRERLLARCPRPAPEAVTAFLAGYRERGKSHWKLQAEILSGGEPAVRLLGSFHAWRPRAE